MNRGPIVLTAFTVALAGCAILPRPLRGLIGSSEDKPAIDRGKLDPAEVRVVEAAPHVATAGPIRPSWCSGDPVGNAGWFERSVKSYFRGDGDQLSQIFQVACALPDDPNVQRQLGYIVQDWINATSQSPADGLASLVARTRTDWSDGLAATCRQFQIKPEEPLEDEALRELTISLLGCSDLRAEKVSWFVDREQQMPSEILRVAFLRLHISQAHGADVMGGTLSYLVQIPEVTRLDVRRFEKEVAAAAWTAQSKMLVRERLAELRLAIKHRQTVLAALAKDDPTYLELGRVADRSWSEWQAIRTKNAAIFDAGYALEKALRGKTLDAAGGCGARFRPLVAARLAQHRPATIEAAVDAVARGPVGEQLGYWNRLCELVEGDMAMFDVAPGSLMEEIRAQHRGPRLAAYRAVVAAIDAIKAKRPAFPLSTQQFTGFGRPADPRVKRAIEQAPSRPSGGKGVIARLEPARGGVRVTFKKVTEKEQEWDCKGTNRAYTLTDGRVQYEKDCKKAGVTTHDLTTAPVMIAAAQAEGLRAGMTMAYARSTATEVALPYMATRGKKLVRVFGYRL